MTTPTEQDIRFAAMIPQLRQQAGASSLSMAEFCLAIARLASNDAVLQAALRNSTYSRALPRDTAPALPALDPIQQK